MDILDTEDKREIKDNKYETIIQKRNEKFKDLDKRIEKELKNKDSINTATLIGQTLKQPFLSTSLKDARDIKLKDYETALRTIEKSYCVDCTPKIILQCGFFDNIFSNNFRDNIKSIANSQIFPNEIKNEIENFLFSSHAFCYIPFDIKNFNYIAENFISEKFPESFKNIIDSVLDIETDFVFQQYSQNNQGLYKETLKSKISALPKLLDEAKKECNLSTDELSVFAGNVISHFLFPISRYINGKTDFSNEIFKLPYINKELYDEAIAKNIKKIEQKDIKNFLEQKGPDSQNKLADFVKTLYDKELYSSCRELILKIYETTEEPFNPIFDPEHAKEYQFNKYEIFNNEKEKLSNEYEIDIDKLKEKLMKRNENPDISGEYIVPIDRDTQAYKTIEDIVNKANEYNIYDDNRLMRNSQEFIKYLRENIELISPQVVEKLLNEKSQENLKAIDVLPYLAAVYPNAFKTFYRISYRFRRTDFENFKNDYFAAGGKFPLAPKDNSWFDER